MKRQHSAKQRRPRITVAINSYRNAHMLRLCIASVQKALSDIDGELIVADSATQDDTRDLMRQEFPDIQFLPDAANIGFGAMVNKCLAVATGTYIFLINSDTIVEEHTLRDLCAYFDTHPEIGILAPAQKLFSGKVIPTYFRFYRPLTVVYRRTPLGRFAFARRHLAHFEMQDYKRRTPCAVDWVMGSALMVQRVKAQDVGGMDPRFFMYMEDVDWCRRFWEKGYPVVYHPAITMYHYYGKGSATGGFWRSLLRNRLTWIHIASAVKYFFKYGGKRNPRLRSMGEVG